MTLPSPSSPTPPPHLISFTPSLPHPPSLQTFSPAPSISIILLLIVLSSSVIFLNFLLYLPQGLQSLFLISPYSFTNFQYSIFFSAWTYPNIVLPLLIGLFLDYKGITWNMAVGLGIAVVAGQGIILAGVIKNSFFLMIFGRFLFGVGLESIQLVLRKIITLMFRPEDLIIGFGVYLFNVRMGNLFASGLSPVIVNFLTLPNTFLFALLLSFLSVLTFFASICILNASFVNDIGVEQTSLAYDGNRSEAAVLKAFDLTEIGKLLLNFFRTCPRFLYVFWLFTLLCVSFYYGFIAGANNFLVSGLDIEKEEAGIILMGFCALLGISQPIMGKIMAHFGHTLYFFLFSSSIVFLSLLCFLLIYPFKQVSLFLLPLFLIAILWSIISNFLFSFIPLAISKHEFGIAYGLFQCMFNIGACIGPPVLGVIVDATKWKMDGYFWSLVVEMMNVAAVTVAGGIVGLMGRQKVGILLGK